MDSVLETHDLKTYFSVDEGTLKAVDNVSFHIGKMETLGLIGESGCGKSVTAQSILRIVPPPGKVISGQILFHREDGKVLDLARFDSKSESIRAIRGKEIALIFQEPMTSFSPVHTIGNQIIEAILLHRTRDKKEAKKLAIDMLAKVGMPNPTLQIESYPGQLSGGQRQRAMIAMALSCSPKLLIADEPTTALDVTVQAQILELMKVLQQQFGMAMLYITHDLGVISEISDNVAVMYLGKIVEYSNSREIFHNPLHPYTRSLLKSIPTIGKKARVRLKAIKGNVPIPLDLPIECGFYGRCPDAIPEICNKAMPDYYEVKAGHFVRCFLHHRERQKED